MQEPAATPPEPAAKPKRQRFGRAQKAALIIIFAPWAFTVPAWLLLDKMDAALWVAMTGSQIEWGITVTIGGGVVLESVRAIADAFAARYGKPQ
jgi:hypothetical protein